MSSKHPQYVHLYVPSYGDGPTRTRCGLKLNKNIGWSGEEGEVTCPDCRLLVTIDRKMAPAEERITRERSEFYRQTADEIEDYCRIMKMPTASTRVSTILDSMRRQ